MKIKLNYKQKAQWTAMAAIPVLLVCLKFAFLPTWNLRAQYEMHRKQLFDLSINDSLTYLEQQAANYERLCKQYATSYTQGDSAFVNQLQNYTNNFHADIKLVDYKPLSTTAKGVWTRQITLEGNFIDLNTFIYLLETQNRIGRIASAHFKKYKSINQDKPTLSCQIYFQNEIKKDTL